MGYYTWYNLTIHNQTEERKKTISEWARENIGFFSWIKPKDGEPEGTIEEDLHYESHKWYNHTNDMLMLSERFPDVFFELEGDGEESDDFWREYYYDGTSEFAMGEIVFAPCTIVPNNYFTRMEKEKENGNDA